MANTEPTIEVLGVDVAEQGHLVLAVRITKSDGGAYERQVYVPAMEWQAMAAVTDLQAWLKEKFPAPPSWVTALIGTTIAF